MAVSHQREEDDVKLTSFCSHEMNQKLQITKTTAENTKNDFQDEGVEEKCVRLPA